MPEFRNTFSGAVMTVPEGRRLGPDWEPVNRSAPSPRRRATKKATSQAEETSSTDD